MKPRPSNISLARWRFAQLLRKYLLEEASPVRPLLGWSQTDFAAKCSVSNTSITYWLHGKQLPKDETTLEKIISVLWANHSGFETRKSNLRKTWREANNERHRGVSFLNSEKHRRTWLSSFFQMEQLSWTVTHLIELIVHGPLSVEVTTKIVRYIEWANEVEKALIHKALVEILLAETSKIEDQAAQAIVASSLSKNSTWQPTETDLERLAQKSRTILSKSWMGSATVSPISVAMARAGRRDILESTLKMLILDKDVGSDDFDRVTVYYGNEFSQYHHILAHFNDPHRSGLILANDTNTLIRLAASEFIPNEKKAAIKPNLLLSAQLLFGTGLEAEARIARAKAEQIR